MKAGPLAWCAQVAAHAAYVEQRRRLPLPAPVVGNRRRSPQAAERNRQCLLDALADGRKHPFSDLSAALPNLSPQGIYYLVEALKSEGRLDYTAINRTNRTYFLPGGNRHA